MLSDAFQVENKSLRVVSRIAYKRPKRVAEFHHFPRKPVKMNSFAFTLLVLIGLASATEITITTAALGGTAAFLLGAKLLAAKGLLLGAALGSRRGRREVEDLGQVFLEATRKDQYDCAKMLICELHAKPVSELKVRLTEL